MAIKTYDLNIYYDFNNWAWTQRYATNDVFRTPRGTLRAIAEYKKLKAEGTCRTMRDCQLYLIRQDSNSADQVIVGYDYISDELQSLVRSFLYKGKSIGLWHNVYKLKHILSGRRSPVDKETGEYDNSDPYNQIQMEVWLTAVKERDFDEPVYAQHRANKELFDLLDIMQDEFTIEQKLDFCIEYAPLYDIAIPKTWRNAHEYKDHVRMNAEQEFYSQDMKGYYCTYKLSREKRAQSIGSFTTTELDMVFGQLKWYMQNGISPTYCRVYDERAFKERLLLPAEAETFIECDLTFIENKWGNGQTKDIEDTEEDYSDFEECEFDTDMDNHYLELYAF